MRPRTHRFAPTLVDLDARELPTAGLASGLGDALQSVDLGAVVGSVRAAAGAAADQLIDLLPAGVKFEVVDQILTPPADPPPADEKSGDPFAASLDTFSPAPPSAGGGGGVIAVVVEVPRPAPAPAETGGSVPSRDARGERVREWLDRADEKADRIPLAAGAFPRAEVRLRSVLEAVRSGHFDRVVVLMSELRAAGANVAAAGQPGDPSAPPAVSQPQTPQSPAVEPLFQGPAVGAADGLVYYQSEGAPPGDPLRAAEPDPAAGEVARPAAELVESDAPLALPRVDPAAVGEVFWRFLPFDTAALQGDVNAFLDDLTDAIPELPGPDLCGNWWAYAAGAAAAFYAGRRAGVRKAVAWVAARCAGASRRGDDDTRAA